MSASTARPSAKPRSLAENPLLAPRWDPFTGLPPFARIEPRHFRSAFETAFAAHRREIAAIARRDVRPTFANTLAALERSGSLLDRVGAVFFALAGAHTDDELQAIEREIAPRYAAHESAIVLDRKLFERIEHLYAHRDRLRLSDEQRRVLELQYLRFVRGGAKLAQADRQRVTAIRARLARLMTQFSQNVLKDEQSWHLVLEDERDLAGLPAAVIEAARRAAADAGLDGKPIITLSRSLVEPFLQFSDRRDLREEAFKAWVGRGERGGETDNRGILAEIVELRLELARLLGYESYADYSLADSMAKSPDSVRGLLSSVWAKAVRRAEAERTDLERANAAAGRNYKIEPWDWRYLAEQVRRGRFDLSDAEVRPYFTLDNMIAAAFATASRLFGVAFEELAKAPRYHPDVRVWRATNAAGEVLGLFMGDYYARSSKRSGAWMTSLRTQHKLGRGQRPIVINVMNFSRAADGKPALLSFDDARTLFHEFGHALHGLLSDVTYPSISGTSVVRDFVELPSQLLEHWLTVPQVLESFARHHETGKAMPERLMRRIEAAQKFNSGWDTLTYTASALVDFELHALKDATALEVGAFEADVLARIGMPHGVHMRHRLPHFLHIADWGYAAGYYSYMWSEVMDADAFAAFEEKGDPFAPDVARRLEKFIYAAGNLRDPEEAYVAFRGHPPAVEGLLRKRGLL